jgi:hypothetical protein
MLRQDRRRRSVVWTNVLEDGVVTGLFGMVIDDEIDVWQQSREIMRLDIHEGDAIERLDLLGRHDLDLQIEELEHAQVFGPAHAIHAPDDRRLARAPQNVAQREPTRDGVGIGIVVQKDENAVGVGQEALVLLDALARDRPAQLDEKCRARELRQRQTRNLGKRLAQFVRALRVLRRRAEHPHQRPARGAHRLQDFAQRSSAVVFDDDARARREIGFDESVEPFGVAYTDSKAGLVKSARQRGTFNQDVELGAGCEHRVEQPHNQFRVTDRETPHSLKASRPVSGISIPKDPL